MDVKNCSARQQQVCRGAPHLRRKPRGVQGHSPDGVTGESPELLPSFFYAPRSHTRRAGPRVRGSLGCSPTEWAKNRPCFFSHRECLEIQRQASSLVTGEIVSQDHTLPAIVVPGE